MYCIFSYWHESPPGCGGKDNWKPHALMDIKFSWKRSLGFQKCLLLDWTHAWSKSMGELVLISNVPDAYFAEFMTSSLFHWGCIRLTLRAVTRTMLTQHCSPTLRVPQKQIQVAGIESRDSEMSCKTWPGRQNTLLLLQPPCRWHCLDCLAIAKGPLTWADEAFQVHHLPVSAGAVGLCVSVA